jgi:CheY-like chemotaxis protein
MNSGPIIIIEDDEDDKELFEDVLKDLNVINKLVWFYSCIDAMVYLASSSEQPFVIFCDVNLPMQNGIEFKKMIDKNENLRKKSIPFVFYSTSVNQSIVNEAYMGMTIQGFFKKGDDYEQIKKDIRLILDYWSACKHPNSD